MFHCLQEIRGRKVVCDLQLYLDVIHAGMRGDEAAHELKLNAFAKRRDEKKERDAYDIRAAVSSYAGGAGAAIKAFKIEKEMNNPAMELALETLARDFSHLDGDGPLLARRFRFGSAQGSERGLCLRTDLVAIGRE